MMLCHFAAITKALPPVLLSMAAVLAGTADAGAQQKHVKGALMSSSSTWQPLRDGTSGTVLFGKFDGTGKADIIRQTNAGLEISVDAVGPWQTINPNVIVPLHDMRTGDFDGDGVDDLFASDGATWSVAYGGTPPWVSVNGSSIDPDDLFIGDFDRDGKADVFATWGGHWHVSWGGKSGWAEVNASSLQMKKVFSDLALGDFDGDGSTDVLGSWGGQWRVSYGGAGKWSVINASAVAAGDMLVGQFELELGGGVDIAAVWGGAAHVSPAATHPWQVLASSFPFDLKGARVADFDGDGLDDIVLTFDCFGGAGNKPPPSFYAKDGPCERKPGGGGPDDEVVGQAGCGGHDEFACNRTDCDRGLQLASGKCYSCGLVGQFCCQDNPGSRTSPKECYHGAVCAAFGNTCQKP